MIKTILLLFSMLYMVSTSRHMVNKLRRWAINCGSSRSKRRSEYGGIVYDSDSNYDKNIETIEIDYSKKDEYKNEIIYYSYDNEIFMTQRYSHGNIKYFVPLEGQKEASTFTLILSFVEMQFTRSNKRQFDIKLGNQEVLQNLDVASKNRSGKFYLHEEYLEFQLKGNQIIWKKPKSQETYFIDLNEDKTLTLEFVQKKDYPIINAIMLYESPIHDTNFYQLQVEKDRWVKSNSGKLRQQYNKRKAHEEAEQLEKNKRQKYNYDKKEYEQWEKMQDEANREIPPFRELLMTPFGVVASIGFFVSTFVLIYFTFFDPYGIEKAERERQNLPVSSKKKVYSQVSQNEGLSERK